MSGGRNGGPQHQELVDTVRFALLTKLWKAGYPWAASQVNEQLMAATIGTVAARHGGQLPDVILWAELCPPEGYISQVCEPISPPLLVEVGRFDASKWPPYLPVLHVGFNRRVSLVNGTGRKFEQVVADELRDLLTVPVALL